MTKRKEQQGYFWFRVEFSRHAFDMSSLTWAEQGLYQHLMWMDCAGQKIPADPTLLAKSVKGKPLLAKSVLEKMEHMFVQDGDRLHHVEVVEHKALAEARSAQATRAVASRRDRQGGTDVPPNTPPQGSPEGYGRSTDVPHFQANQGGGEGYERTTSKVKYSREEQVPARPSTPSPQTSRDSEDFDRDSTIPFGDDQEGRLAV